MSLITEELPPHNTSDNPSDTDSDDENYDKQFQKLENSFQYNMLFKSHPELQQINYEELEAKSTIVRDEMGNIIDEFHKTLPFLTKYEKTRILGIRTKQINNGSSIFIDVADDVVDEYIIACKELEAKVLPFIIQRPLPNGKSEFWKLDDLELIH